MRAKTDDPTLLEKMYHYAEQSDRALTVQSGAEELRVAWATARSLLRTLVSQSRLEAIATANGWVFRAKKSVEVPAE
jgi:response regulator of citrate/malate metabolism